MGTEDVSDKPFRAAPTAADTETTVWDAFQRSRQHCGSMPFLHIPEHCGGGPVDLTYEEMGTAVEATMEVYRRAGYGPGHHVALWLDSRDSFYLHWLTLNALGATVVPLGAELSVAEARLLLLRADIDLLVHLPERSSTAREATAHVGDGLTSIATPDDFAANLLPRASTPRSADARVDAAAIVFTSGSTGEPKGCMLSNEYFLFFGRWYRDMGGRCELRPGRERLITALPLNHVNALAFSSMGMILTGGCIIQLDRFRSSTWWKTVNTTGATVMHYLGVMPAMLLQLPRQPDEKTHSLRFGIGGGVRAAHHSAFEDRFAVPLIEAWAMTETGGAGTLSTHVGPRNIGSGCIGRPSPRYAEATLAGENGAPVSGRLCPGEGELLVRASGDDPRRGFFSGYYKDPDATAAAWQHGWLHTGDLARRDAEDRYFFVGRRKQIIRRSGENISAAEVEAALGADQRIKEAAVVAVPDELREEEVFACVVASADSTGSRELAEEILAAAAARLAYYKLPGYIAFVTALPVTATQKLRYGTVAELAAALIRNQGPELFDVRDAKRNLRSTH
jgi:acyl-CoA synthetase (AMP-forming)/AMP-acid ligase II